MTSDPTQPLSRDESLRLDSIADWLDGLYLRLQATELVLDTESVRADEYCESLQGDLDTASQVGISAGRSMEHCAMLFEQLAVGAVASDSVVRARAEINLLAVAVRQLALEPQRNDTQADPWAAHCEEMEARGFTHAETARSWKSTHPSERKTIAQLQKRSENYRAKRDRGRKSAESPT